MYDAFAKEVLNPETTPEGLDEFLSLLLGQKVRVVQALLDDNTRIADENSLLVTDIVVRLEDGSLANLEFKNWISVSRAVFSLLWRGFAFVSV